MSTLDIQEAATTARMFLFNQPDLRATAEEITNACKRAGHTPADDRAFGGVMAYLSRNGLARIVDHCQRKRGHGTDGGHVWELV